MIAVVEEIAGEEVCCRLGRCDCGAPACETYMLAGRKHRGDDPRDALWLTVGVVFDGDCEGLRNSAAFLVENLEDNGLVPSEALDVGCALLGMPWTKMNRGVCRDQLSAYEAVPAGMTAIHADELWLIRRLTFGNPLTCVVRAVDAMAESYQPDHPVDPRAVRWES